MADTHSHICLISMNVACMWRPAKISFTVISRMIAYTKHLYYTISQFNLFYVRIQMTMWHTIAIYGRRTDVFP